MQNSPLKKQTQSVQPKENNQQPAIPKKKQNPKDHVMQNFTELKFVDNIFCAQRGTLRLFRFHPFTKYMASKLVCSVPLTSLPQGHAQQLLKQYQERCKIKQPHIIYSLASESQNVSKNTQQGLMKLFQIQLFFEFNQFTLDQLAETRRDKKSLIPEAEGWCLLKGVISGLVYLQQKGISHGMISTHNIYFDEEYLLYRVYDQELMNGRWANWIKCQQFMRGKTNKFFNKSDYEDALLYLAPECQKYLDLEVQQMEEKIDPYKADIYSFGITLVNAFSLKQKLTIQQGLDWIQTYYSEEFLSIILLCLQKQSQLRPDWIQLQTSVNLVPESIQKKNLPSTLKTPTPKKQEVLVDQSMTASRNKFQESQFIQNNEHNQSQSSIFTQRNEDEEVELKLLQLNKKIEDTLMKSFSKTKTLR